MTPELAEMYRDEAARCYGGDLSAALSAAVEQWALSALRAHGVAPIEPVGADQPRTGRSGPADRPAGRPAGRPGATPAPEADRDLTDPHWD